MTLIAADELSVPLLRSALLPPEFVHGFSYRGELGGGGPGFNLAGAWGNQPAQVEENRRRLLAALGGEQLFLVKQMHGVEVARVGPGDTPQALAAVAADALITDRPGAVIGVFEADCVPVLLADPDTGACAAIHAGWRGVVAGVVTATVRRLSDQYGVHPWSLRAALGPAIGPCCFEVGLEVVQQFAALPGLDLAEVVHQPPGAARPHIDMRRTLRRELERLGVPPQQIDEGRECTRCDPQRRFFSFRRDGRLGQQLAVIKRGG